MRKEVVMKRVRFSVLALGLVVSLAFESNYARAGAQISNDLLEFLPDGDAVIVMDIKRLTSSGIWGTISSRDPIKSVVDGVQSETGMKLTDVDRVAIAFSGSRVKTPVVALSGAINQNDLLARIRSDRKVKLTSTKYKNFEVYDVENAATSGPTKRNGIDDMSFVFYDSTTIIVGPNASVRASIDVKSGQAPSIAQNAKLRGALAENSSAAARFAAVLSPAMTSAMKTSSIPLPDFSTIIMAFGAVDVTSSVDFDVTLRSDTAEHAKALADHLNGLLGMARGFLGSGTGDAKSVAIAGALKSVTITGVEAEVKITGNLPGELLSQMLR
jgi:hypothetical protein